MFPSTAKHNDTVQQRKYSNVRPLNMNCENERENWMNEREGERERKRGWIPMLVSFHNFSLRDQSDDFHPVNENRMERRRRYSGAINTS